MGIEKEEVLAIAGRAGKVGCGVFLVVGDDVYVDGEPITTALTHALEEAYAAGARERQEAADELLAALQDLLMDTQHSEHKCSDKQCPVARAKAVALKYDGGQA